MRHNALPFYDQFLTLQDKQQSQNTYHQHLGSAWSIPRLGVGNYGLKAKPSLLPIFCIACELRIVYFLMFFFSNQRRRIFCDMEALYKIKISVSLNKVLLEFKHIHSSAFTI